MKKVVTAIIGVLILGGVYFATQGFRSEDAAGKKEREQKPIAVEVGDIRTDSVSEVRVFTGTLTPRRYVTIAPKIGGRLEKLMFDIGDPIENGSLVAILDESEYVQQVEQARAELHVADANLQEAGTACDVARRDFERAEALRERMVVSEADLDAANSKYQAAQARRKVAEAQVAQRQAALRAAEIRLSYTRVEASWDSDAETFVVGERFVDAGSLLRANDPIVSAIDISHVTAVINVAERDYPLLRVGQAATARADAFPNQVFFGEVSRMAPLLKEHSRQARVEITLPNPDKLLKPGMFVRAEITFAKHDNVTVIPVEALVRRDGQTGFFYVNDADGQSKAEFVKPVLGIVSSRNVEIIEPQIAGQVVTLGHHLLEDGTPLIIPGRDAAGQSPAGTDSDDSPATNDTAGGDQ